MAILLPDEISGVISGYLKQYKNSRKNKQIRRIRQPC